MVSNTVFFIFIPIWGRFPIWLIFFRWVETTNQYWWQPEIRDQLTRLVGYLIIYDGSLYISRISEPSRVWPFHGLQETWQHGWHFFTSSLKIFRDGELSGMMAFANLVTAHMANVWPKKASAVGAAWKQKKGSASASMQKPKKIQRH